MPFLLFRLIYALTRLYGDLRYQLGGAAVSTRIFHGAGGEGLPQVPKVDKSVEESTLPFLTPLHLAFAHCAFLL